MPLTSQSPRSTTSAIMNTSSAVATLRTPINSPTRASICVCSTSATAMAPFPKGV
jgi:hypothetical protein